MKASQEIFEVCRLYNLGRPVGAVSTGGTRNLNQIISTEKGAWFVRKRHPDFCREERIQFDHRAVSYLRERGVKVPSIIASGSGETWCVVNGSFYEVHEPVEGEPLKRGDEAHLASLAGAIADFHLKGRGFSFRYEKEGGRRGETSPRELTAVIEKISGISPETAPALSHYRELVGGDVPAVETENYDGLPDVLVHGDVQPANVLQDGRGSVLALVDFDWCGFRPRIYDIAFAVLFCCSRQDDSDEHPEIYRLTGTPSFPPGKARNFMKAYEAGGGELAEEERKALCRQLALTWCHTRLHGALKVPAGEREKFLTRGIDRIRAELAAANNEIASC